MWYDLRPKARGNGVFYNVAPPLHQNEQIRYHVEFVRFDAMGVQHCNTHHLFELLDANHTTCRMCCFPTAWATCCHTKILGEMLMKADGHPGKSSNINWANYTLGL